MTHQPFNRAVLKTHRNRAAPSFSSHDFLIQEAVDNILERLNETSRRFPRVLALGSHLGVMGKALQALPSTETCIQTDLSFAMLKGEAGYFVQCDEERIPFRDECIDLVVSTHVLHFVNDLPGCLVQLRRMLRENGMIMLTFFGGNTLTELRQAFMHMAETLKRPVSPHVAPFVDVRDAGSLLQRAGFAMPIVDSREITVSYPNILRLMHDLRGMAETNILHVRAPYGLTRQEIATLDTSYRTLFPQEDDSLHVTFEVLTCTGIKV